MRQPRSPRPISPDVQPPAFKLPSDISPWATYDEAIKGLTDDGWTHAKYIPLFSSTQLCAQVQSLLDGTTVTVEDCTSSLPSGPGANLKEYGLLVRNLESVSTICPDKIYVVMRTLENTPAFLGGTTYVYTLEMRSKEKAVDFTRKMATPFLIALFRGVHIVLPTVAAQGSPLIPSKIISAMVNDRSTGFECAVCCESFLVKHDEHEYELKSFLATDCDHAFHPQCIVKQLAAGITTCATCRGPLPYDWVPPGQTARPRSDDPFRQPVEIGELTSTVDGLAASIDRVVLS